MVVGESSFKEYLKLASIILFITAIAFFLANGDMVEFLRWFMGTFFLVFACFKFIGYEVFVVMFRGYDILAKKYRPYPYMYPFIELFLGILYILDLGPNFRDLFTIVLMSIGAYGVYEQNKKRNPIKCACLGNVIKLPLSTVSLIEDVGMGVMALAMLVLA